MKTKLLIKTLLMAVGLLVGTNASWADTELFHWAYDNTSSVQSITNGTALTGTTGGTLTPGTTNDQKAFSAKDKISSYAAGVPNDMKAAGTAGTNAYYLKNGSGALSLAVVLTSGTFQAGDVVEICGTGNWGVSTVNNRGNNSGDVIAQIETESSSAFTVASGIIPQSFVASNTLYFARADGTTNGICAIKITRPSNPPAAISFSPAAGSVAAGSSITLTSSGATTIVYQWGASAVDGEGDWSTVETYSDSNKPVVPAAGSTNTVLSVRATNANGSTYGSASYTPVKMAMKTIYSFADGIGSQAVEAATASVGSPMSISDTSGKIKLTAATGSQFKNGDAIEFSGSVGNTSKKYGIYYGPTTSLGTDLYVAAGQPCHVSGTLTLASATSDLYIGRYDGTTTNFTTFTIRRLTEATSEAYAGVKIDGSAATEDVDYTKEGSVITLTSTYTAAPTVYLVNHIVFADASTEDQNVLVAFDSHDGNNFTGTAVIDGTTYTVKAPASQINALKVVYKDGGTTIKEENITVTSSMKVGSSYTVPFRMYVEKDGALYKTTANGSTYYGDAVTLEYNTTVTKSVSSVDLGGGTLVLLEDLDDSGDNGASTRASNCSAYINKAYTSASNLPAGKYNFIFRVENINNRGSYIKVGDTEVYQTNSRDKGAWNDVEVNNVIIPTAGALTLAKSGSAYDGYDILIAIRTGDATVSKSISSAGWATYCSPYALDLENATGLTDAYIVTGGATGVLAKTSVKGGKVAANTGLLIKGDAGTATIPVVASGTDYSATNKLVGVTTETVLDLDSNDDGTPDSYVYVLMNDATNGLGFYQTTTTSFTVGANTAYLPANFDGSGARFFSLFDDATGINAVNGEESMVNGSVFNLAGQRVAQPTKGLYILNGKKVIIK